ncbi:MAG: iron-sulfur cluster assembly accessory protein, partial [Methylobacteriaceae bacterium]
MADINLTARAAKRINEIMGAEPPGSSLRISVNGGGCSGFS